MTIKINNKNSEPQTLSEKLSNRTINTLKELGTDINRTNSETEAISIINNIKSEIKFKDMTEVNNNNEEKTTIVSETYLITSAKKLAQELGIKLKGNESFEEINTSIAKNIKTYMQCYSSNPIALERAKKYQTKLSMLTKKYDSISDLNTKMLDALNTQAKNNKTIHGIDE